MICTKCGNTVIQTRRIDTAEHQATNLTTCLICGEILSDEVVANVGERDMSNDQFVCRVKNKRGRNVGLSCSVDGCVKSAYSRGLCRTHYSQWRRYKYQLNALDVEFNAVISAVR